MCLERATNQQNASDRAVGDGTRVAAGNFGMRRRGGCNVRGYVAVNQHKLPHLYDYCSYQYKCIFCWEFMIIRVLLFL
jgi:hypothetical protein